MLEVFKTNVESKSQATVLTTALCQLFPTCRINFDLDDCDRILRLEGDSFCVITTISLLNEMGYWCEVLE
jgi:hypothetical protein